MQPVVVNGRDGDQRECFLEIGTSWFQHGDEWAAMPAVDGPDTWQRIDVAIDQSRQEPQGQGTEDCGDPQSSTSRRVNIVQPVQDIDVVELPEVEVTNVDIGEQSVEFDVSEPGVPVLVRVSYFPNWTAHGAEGPYRIGPNQMVVVPTDTHVRLAYERSNSDLFFYGLTILGIALALFARFRDWNFPKLARSGGARRRPRRRAGRQRLPPGTDVDAVDWAPQPQLPAHRRRAITTSTTLVGAAGAGAPSTASGHRRSNGLLDSLTAAMSVLDEIVKAYDIRGTVPDQLNAEVARAFGVAFASHTAASPGASSPATCARPDPSWSPPSPTGCSPRASTSSTSGWRRPTSCTTRPGVRRLPAAIFTASHNPAEYNGIKLCHAGAMPGRPRGDQAADQRTCSTVAGPAPAQRRERRTEEDLLADFVDHVVSFIDVDALRPRRVVADTANGMGGLVVPAVFERLGVFELEVMYPELDGTFPNHPADPLQPANQRDLRARVVSGGFDIGLAFDGDADRVFVVDETGAGLSGSTTTAILSAVTLRAHPGATILHNLICSRGRARGDRRERRRAGAHPGRPFVHQAADGRDRCGVRRRALGALLLRRELRRRLRADRHRADAVRADPHRRRAVEGARAVRALHAERRDQHPRRRRRRRARRGQRDAMPTAGRTASTGSPSSSTRGGSTCGRRTPSRCCASTSRPRPATSAKAASPSCSR